MKEKNKTYNMLCCVKTGLKYLKVNVLSFTNTFLGFRFFFNQTLYKDDCQLCYERYN